MKIQLTILLLCTGYLCLAQTKSISVTTSFNGFHCDGKPGLCSIDNQQNRLLSNTLLTIQNTTLTMVIKRHYLSDLEVKSLFNLQSLQLDESKRYYLKLSNAFPLQPSVTKNIGESKTSLSISKGTYPIQITEDYFTIIFNTE